MGVSQNRDGRTPRYLNYEGLMGVCIMGYINDVLINSHVVSQMVPCNEALMSVLNRNQVQLCGLRRAPTPNTPIPKRGV